MKVSFFVAESEWLFFRDEGGFAGRGNETFKDAFQAQSVFAPLRFDEAAIKALKRFVVRDLGIKRAEDFKPRDLIHWLADQVAWGSLQFERKARPQTRVRVVGRPAEPEPEAEWQEFEASPTVESEPEVMRVPPENATAIAENNRAMHAEAVPFQAHCQQPNCPVCEGHMAVMQAA